MGIVSEKCLKFKHLSAVRKLLLNEGVLYESDVLTSG